MRPHRIRHRLGCRTVASWLAIGIATVALAAAPPSKPPGAAKSTPAWTTILGASEMFKRFRADSALLVAEAVVRSDEAARDPELMLAARLLQGASFAVTGRPGEAQAPLAAAIALAQARGDSGSWSRGVRYRAYALSLMGRKEETLAAYGQLLAMALASRDSVNEAYARLGVAYQDLLEGSFASGLSGYDRAIALFHDREPGLERTAVIGRCRCLYGMNRFDDSRTCYEQVVELSRGASDVFNHTDALNNLGTIEHLTGDLGAAMRRYQEAYDLRVVANDVLGVVTPATNLALIHTELGQYRDAERVLAVALERSRQGDYPLGQAQTLHRFAELRAAEHRYAESAAYLRSAIGLVGSLPPDTRAQTVLILGQTLGLMDSAAAGIEVLARASARLDPGVSAYVAGALDLARADLLSQEGRHAESLVAAERALAHARRTESLDLQLRVQTRAGIEALRLGHRDDARARLEAAAQVWEQNRERQSDPEVREFLGASARLCVSGLLEIAADGGDAAATARAFEILQRFKTRTLRERMRGPAGASADDSTSAAPSLAEMQAVLEGRELLLEAFAGPTVSLLVAVTPTVVRIVRLPESDSLATRLRRYRSLASSDQGGAARGANSSRATSASASRGTATDRAYLEAAGRGVGTLLLDPVADLIATCERVIVAPDGELSMIPWAALSLSGAAGIEPLAQHREVVMVPSAAVLADLRRRGVAARGRPGSVLAVAAEPSGRQHLAGASREVAALGQRFESVSVRPGVHPDSARSFAQYDLLHFAAHTSLDDQHPWRSGIELGTGGAAGTDSTGAGVLRAVRIATWPLDARLAVLSACESAGGRLTAGEGMLGLTSAFVSAGVPATVATLWPVSDRVTERFMRAFYDGLARDHTVAAALREAQLDVRANPATAHPFYWAGFVVFGDGDVRIPLRDRSRQWPWALGGGIVLLALVMRKRRSATAPAAVTNPSGGTPTP